MIPRKTFISMTLYLNINNLLFVGTSNCERPKGYERSSLDTKKFF